MSEWSSLKLADAPLEILDGDRGKNYPSQDEFTDFGYCLFLSTKNVRSIGFDFSECQFISKQRDELLRKGRLERNDVVLTTRGTVGNLGFFNEKVNYEKIRINSGMVIIRPDATKLLPAFNFYTFRKLQSDFLTFTSGSAQPQLPIRDLKEIEISIPPLEEQKAIASVLSSLDDKIDLLNRQNTTLESMAETLFRQWFVEEAQEDWEEGKLSDVSDNIRQSVQAKDIQATTKYIGLEHIDRRNIALKQYGVGEDVSSNKYAFEKNDILFGKLRPYFHKVCFSPFSGICSTDILVIRPKSSDYFAFCLFAYFQNDVVEYANLGSGGTRMPRTDWETLKQYPISLPDKNTLLKFNDIVLPSINQITENLVQIQTLEKLRDNLLPKLMNGEIRINND